ncbi:hypothetical protein AcW1_009423 [Taiwanofungus camphoratus]|nr:hypothetical protein AcW1_009423 [Antrodia cinnamomea]
MGCHGKATGYSGACPSCQSPRQSSLLELVTELLICEQSQEQRVLSIETSKATRTRTSSSALETLDTTNLARHDIGKGIYLMFRIIQNDHREITADVTGLTKSHLRPER